MSQHQSRRRFLRNSLVAGASSVAWGLASRLGLAGLFPGDSGFPWLKIQMPTAAEVAARWKEPPAEHGPEPYYGLNGDVDMAVIERDLDTMKSLGFRAVTAQAGRGMRYPYLSESYFSFYRKFVEQAKKRGMKVWIVDEAGYPSGFAGGKFTKLKPKLRMQALELARKFPVAGGETRTDELPRNTVSVMAVNSEGVHHVVPVKDGRLNWTVPPGNWTVMMVAHEFRTSPTRSATNSRNVKDTEQSLEDYMNPAATRQFIAWTHEQYKHYMGGEFGRAILGFRGDEPDYSIRGLPWTNSFFARFQQIKGYDVRPYVPSFFLIEMTDEERRAKADYWDVFSQMFSAGFFRVLGDWCAANHLEYQFHLNHEEREMLLAHSEGSFFRDMRPLQVPGIDAIWHQIWMDTISDYPRLASSAAHVYGKPWAFTESFAAYHPIPNVEQVRYILNEQMVRGVNLVEVMYFPATSRGPRRPMFFMGDPGFPDLMQYVRRLCYLMSMGRPAASVALYIPTSSFWLGDAAANREFVATERFLSEHQIDFDIVNEDALARDLLAGKGTFQTLSGNRYRTVILPGGDLISQTVLDRLRAFARSGGNVVFLGHLPRLIAGRTIRDARPATPADFSWATVEVSAQLSAPPTPGQLPPPHPPSPQVVPDAVLKAVTGAIPQRDVMLDAPDRALRTMRRQLKDASVFLFFNEGARSMHHTVTLVSKGARAEVWDPQTALIRHLPSTAGKGSLKIDLSLQPYETRVVVVR